MLPNIGQPAAQVYKRVIPQPNGDCKLLDDVSNAKFFCEYNLTITGLSVSIACNTTAANNVGGLAIPLGGAPSLPSGVAQSSNSSVPLISPGNASTDGAN